MSACMLNKPRSIRLLTFLPRFCCEKVGHVDNVQTFSEHGGLDSRLQTRRKYLSRTT